MAIEDEENQGTALEPAGRADAVRLTEQLERAIADAERHPGDTTVGGRLIDEMAAAGGRLGQAALDLAPAFWSEQQAVDKILARFANDIGVDVETVLAARRYALTGDRRALDGTWL
ncbi:hypothetical protein [Streptomyces agglomeratus]|uniref:hypothetical protein n=1 Tax=Streptomyces agglomeratus TaxID=285458 RepID=UPI0008546B77|nr:hypothetical protein [Streptomyces agglomeratus]OEJ49653.1 hypothetical protein BGK72_01360 [Streptomyces agglomeratus]